MRPAHKSISAGVWKFESRLVSHFEAALLSIRTWSFDRYRFAEAHPIRSFFHPKGERYISMSTKLYVGNLAFQTTTQELEQLFGRAHPDGRAGREDDGTETETRRGGGRGLG